MTPQLYKRGLFIFHRDLRVADNTALLEAAKRCEKVYTIFVFTPEQVTSQNRYKSDNAVEFMIESLQDLKKQIRKLGGRLFTFYGNQNDIIKQFIRKEGVDAVFFNRDYTPYAVKRDTAAQKLCTDFHIPCITTPDLYLYEPGSILSGSGDVYKKFTPFYRTVLKLTVDKPSRIKPSNLEVRLSYKRKLISLERAWKRFTSTKKTGERLVTGGRKAGVDRLKASLEQQQNYTEDRDTLSYSTSFLSAYLKFGCVSIREVYHMYKNRYNVNHGLIRELIWRDFFAHLLFKYPEVMGKSYNYRNIKWRDSLSDFNKWCRGETGYPVVDAGMRQLNMTGYMHNRCRMIVADFLVKTLLLDWRWGEKYFAKHLTDYDVASNNGNWQNISSTGILATPYFRNFNPFIQSKKFDKECSYIKKWIPELQNVPPKDIHNWDTACELYRVDYPCPMVDYRTQKRKMLKLFRNGT